MRSVPIPDPGPQESLIALVLGPEHAGARLDRALADAMPGHSRTTLARWIREGRVHVDGRVARPRDAVAGGERVELRVPPPRGTHLEPEDRPLDILYQDEHLLVLDKPPGLVVHPGHGQPDGTLANALVHALRDLPTGTGSDRPGIVHRLDKDTSGVMVVARTDAAQAALARQFAERIVAKTYVAVVHRGDVDAEGEIDLPIARSRTHRTRMAIAEEGHGRPARTRYEVLRRLPRHAVLACYPATGRTHQIRVHLRAIGHPIVGDPFYGLHGAIGEGAAPRLLLHAWRLAFDHPATGERVTFEAPWPDDLVQAIEALAVLRPRT
ncbi:MAG: RluA family pseudouridine synthase [Planctomycetota bacterium]